MPIEGIDGIYSYYHFLLLKHQSTLIDQIMGHSYFQFYINLSILLIIEELIEVLFHHLDDCCKSQEVVILNHTPILSSQVLDLFFL